MPLTIPRPLTQTLVRFTRVTGGLDAIYHGTPEAGAAFNADRSRRYLLWRVWDPSLPYLCVCGLNPSTADEKRLDATCTRCAYRARVMGFGGYVMVNLEAHVSTDPRNLADHMQRYGDYVNDLAIREAALGAGMTIVAWGAHTGTRTRAREVVGILRRAGVELHCLGTTADGSPRHPSRLAYSIQPEPYTAWADDTRRSA